MDSEKLAELKKAYADVIFNMSKEAAMRVMSSEKRAARYQHELKVGKEEALRMLMRLKQMMDFKTSQAEAASFNQQKKIEVLEAQLEEAEDIVNDLRHELEKAQCELEQLRQDNLQNSNPPTNNGIYLYESGKKIPPNSQEKIYDGTMMNPIERNLCSYIRNRDLPSVTVRHIEQGLYRSECAQRIRACEKNLLDKVLYLSEKTDKVNDENNSGEQRQREKEENEEDAGKVPASGAKTLSELEKKLSPDRIFRNLQSFSRKRKRSVRKRKIAMPLSVRYASDIAKGSDCLSQNIKTETRFHLGNEKSLETETSDAEIKISREITSQKDELKEKLVPLDDDEARFEDGFLLENDLESNLRYTSTRLTQHVTERVIKYTFQRKHKREAFRGSNVNGATETENETEAKQNGGHSVKQSKASLLKESSRESRRLAQVARQLFYDYNNAYFLVREEMVGLKVNGFRTRQKFL
ncbi:S-adenosyl-L-methionine-dependentmethyltransferases superfamily protein [Striga asiatica]|uniref:S-adenosyl-L-methionine-dependentmethyltransferases superfamily protein n=1 Tax=Striga asiatica TaxID=4170 RepID=A0A5A7Q0X8_STRAF|nr:S-adenosyl-L-methionine-dependentmethyltransferases superfamily protein [Striga asiatica]